MNLGAQLQRPVSITKPSPKGLSIKYVTLFLANFYSPPLCHTSSHIPGPPRKYVTHLGPPTRILEGLVQKARTKSPLYKFCLNCSRGFCQRVFCLEGFVRGCFCPFLFCQNTSVTSES